MQGETRTIKIKRVGPECWQRVSSPPSVSESWG